MSADRGGIRPTVFRLAAKKRVQYATAVKSLHIRDVPEQTIMRLKRRASWHHRSLQGELQVLLEDAARQAISDDISEFSLHTVWTQGIQNWSREGIGGYRFTDLPKNRAAGNRNTDRTAVRAKRPIRSYRFTEAPKY